MRPSHIDQSLGSPDHSGEGNPGCKSRRAGLWPQVLRNRFVFFLSYLFSAQWPRPALLQPRGPRVALLWFLYILRSKDPVDTGEVM